MPGRRTCGAERANERRRGRARAPQPSCVRRTRCAVCGCLASHVVLLLTLRGRMRGCRNLERGRQTPGRRAARAARAAPRPRLRPARRTPCCSSACVRGTSAHRRLPRIGATRSGIGSRHAAADAAAASLTCRTSARSTTSQPAGLGRGKHAQRPWLGRRVQGQARHARGSTRSALSAVCRRSRISSSASSPLRGNAAAASARPGTAACTALLALFCCGCCCCSRPVCAVAAADRRHCGARTCGSAASSRRAAAAGSAASACRRGSSDHAAAARTCTRHAVAAPAALSHALAAT